MSPAFKKLLVFLTFAGSLGSAQAEEALFERDVLPILTKNCLGCHGGLRQRGDLDMRTIPLMLKGGKSGPVVKAGDANASHLWQRISKDEMPRTEEKLSAEEKQIIQQWINDGMPTVAQRQKNVDTLLTGNNKHDPQQVAKAIDQHINGALEAKKLKPVDKTDDAAFLRRVYVDLTGRVPTAKQAKEFLDSKDSDKRANLIDTLLASKEFGEQLGRTWRDWICPPELPSDGNGGRQPHREAQNLGKWLGERFAAGDSWDRITREILTVKGEIRKNPQVIFFGLAGEGGKIQPNGSARAVASLFMGVQLQCAECHDDPYRSWAQKEFWGVAGFFSNTSGTFTKISEGAKRGSKPGEVTIPKAAFSNAGTKVKVAYLGGGEVQTRNGNELRQKFADWLTKKDNPFFSRAFANRMWFYFFSRGLVNPVDDLRPLNPPSHPGLMKLLANEFKASGYDVKHLIRCICNSDAYQRTTKVAPGTEKEVVKELTAGFGRMPLRIMTADMLYDSLKLAYGDPRLDLRAINPKDGNTNGESAPVADAYLEFLRRFETNEDDPTDFTHGIPQMLTMINHPRLLKGSRALEEFLRTKPAPTPEKTVEWLYLSTLSRRPSSDEAKEAVDYVAESEDTHQAYVGVLWMLVNRSEYMFIR